MPKFGAAEQRGDGALGVGQGVIVSDQNGGGGGDGAVNVTGGEDFLVRAIGVAKVAQVLAAAGRVGGANLALHASDSVELGCTAPRS